MHPTVRSISIFLFSLQISFADESGVCIVTTTKTKLRHVMDRAQNVWKTQVYQTPLTHTQCCEGYMPTSNPKVCTPKCEPTCVNSKCEAPNTCVCLPGHAMANNSSSTCFDICDSCLNADCLNEVELCVCRPNYERDLTNPFACNPICNPTCRNGVCASPGNCTCFEGYVKNNNNDCVPKCSKPCSHGQCSAPNECTCFDGYASDEDSPSICVPICEPSCENGFCESPNSCKCKSGFQLHPRIPFRCVPEPPENSSLNFCELKLYNGIKYDESSDCFMIKDPVQLSVDNSCQLLQSLPQPLCKPQTPCRRECILTFQCLARSINGSKEMHCDLERNDFEMEESANASVAGADWSNITVVINYLQQVNLTLPEEGNHTRLWKLHSLSKWPVCGQQHFGLEICDSYTSSDVVSSSSNTVSLVWLYILIFIIFLIFITLGVGWFMFSRHRKLNDPLHYREEMIRGYTNKGYGSRPPKPKQDDLLQEEEDDDEDAAL